MRSKVINTILLLTTLNLFTHAASASIISQSSGKRHDRERVRAHYYDHINHRYPIHHRKLKFPFLPEMSLGVCEICAHPQEEHILVSSNQNIGRTLPDPCSTYWWWQNIGISGGVNLDFGKWGNRNVSNLLGNEFVIISRPGQGYAGENTKQASINDAYLNIYATVNRYAYAFTSISYINASNYYSVAYQTTPDSLFFGDNNNRLTMQQAFLHLGNFNESPIFFELGQQFQDFGRYSLHPITESMTQALTETLRTSAKLGFVFDNGIHGSAAAFQNPVPKTRGGTLSYDYIGALGYRFQYCDWEFDIGGAYMWDFQGVNLVGNTVAVRTAVPPAFAIYHKRVNAVALYTDLYGYPVGLSLRYIGLAQRMSPLDLPKQLDDLTLGAKPWAASAQINYGFELVGLEQNIYVGYQVSRDTVFLNLPRARYLVGYNAYICNNTTFTAEWDHDEAYPRSEGGPTHNSNLVTLRVGITFA